MTKRILLHLKYPKEILSNWLLFIYIILELIVWPLDIIVHLIEKVTRAAHASTDILYTKSSEIKVEVRKQMRKDNKKNE